MGYPLGKLKPFFKDEASQKKVLEIAISGRFP